MRSRGSHQPHAIALAAVIAVVSLGVTSALADPLVGATTSKVITTIAHIIVERIGGSTVDKILAPYIDDTLNEYLRGDPARVEPVLEERRDQIAQQLGGNSAEKDIPILKAQLELVQKELTALRALQKAPESVALANTDKHLADGVVQMEKKIDTRTAQLDSVQQKLDDVTVRVGQADASAKPAEAAPEKVALQSPSFDCHKAKKEIEHLICDNPTLADIDGRLGKVYWELRHFLAPSESEQLRREEIAWIKHRGERLKSECTPDGKVDLPCVIGLWKERIDQLQAQLQNAKARQL